MPGNNPRRQGLKVIKLEYILRLKIKRNDWLIADTCPQAANHYALFESENELKFYNLEAWFLYSRPRYICVFVCFSVVTFLSVIFPS